MRKRFIAVDFETATPDRWTPCSVGIVVFQENVITEKYYTLIKPPNNEYSVYLTSNVHEIDAVMTENVPEFPEIWEKINHFFKAFPMVYHGGSNFDADVIRQTLHYYNMEDLKHETINTLDYYAQGLNDLCKEHNIPLTHHDPLSDAEACGWLYLKSQGITKPENKNGNRFPERIKGDVLTPDYANVADKENPFYMKKAVITGVFSKYSRNDVAKNIKCLGADVNSSLSIKTDIVIAGDNAGPSKLEKINRFKEEGHLIRVINDSEFNELMDKYL